MTWWSEWPGNRRWCVVVAHPDDEVLWFGGLILTVPAEWTVICCSIPRADPVRAWKFFDACACLNAEARLIPMVEPDKGEPFARNLDWLDLLGYDPVVTHNAVGEYGHPHHLAVNRAMVKRCSDRLLTGGYGKAAGPYRVELGPTLRARKAQALACYDHISPKDSKPKWQALLDRYGPQFDLNVETYERAAA